MTTLNTLIKDTTIDTVVGAELVPAIPYRPATPPRTVYENRVVCGFRYTGAGHYEYLTDPHTLATTLLWVPDAPGGSEGVWACDTELVPVNYPGVPAQLYVPGHSVIVAHTVPGFNLGWNAGGRSIGFFEGAGFVQFQVPVAVVGVIAGLNYYDGLPEVYNGNAIDFAFQCMHGITRIIENGVVTASVGAYTDATVFRIECDGYGGTVSYKMDGTVVHTSSTRAPPAAAWLEAALYSATDSVSGPSIGVDGVDGHATLGASLAPMTFFGGHAGYAALDAALPGLLADIEAGAHATISASLAPMTFFGGRAGFAELDGVLPAITFAMEAGLSAPSFAIMSAEIPAMSMSLDGLTGELGTIGGALSPMVMLAADHAYAQMFTTLEPLNGAFTALEGNFRASISGRAAAAATMAAPTFLTVTIGSAGVISTTMLVGLQLDAALLARATLGSTYALQAVLNAVMQSSARSAAALDDPASDTQTWVVNMDGFGSTTYSNFAFNSFALIGGVYYGANGDGIFALDGDTDDGALIRASVSLGQLDFGRTEQKTVIACYVGMSSAGNLFVKAITDMGTFIYITRGYSPSMKQQRVDFGKGLKTNYVGLEIYNENGADFELDSVEFQVVDLARRI